MAAFNNPNLAVLEMVAQALGPVCESVIFVGGCATGLLLTQERPDRIRIRITEDVDIVAQALTVHDYHAIAVNAIEAEAELGLDMRSNSAVELKKLEDRIMALAREAADDENKRWDKKDVIKVEFKLVGDRPAGAGQIDSPMVHAARRAVATVGGEVKSVAASSTDSNLPINLGIPAVTLGSGGVGGGSHDPGEWFSPINAWLGPQSTLLTVLSLVGVGRCHPAASAEAPALSPDQAVWLRQNPNPINSHAVP